MEKTQAGLDRERLVKMATYQRAVIILYLMYIVASFFLEGVAIALAEMFEFPERYFGLIMIVNVATRIVFYVMFAIHSGRLARAVEGNKALIYRILLWIPCISFFPLIILSARTNRIMKEHGIKVGLLGVNPATIP